MAEIGAGQAFKLAGGTRETREVPYPITYEYVRSACEKREHLLRIQFPDERLPDEDEAVLARLSIDDPTQAWQRWDYLKGLWAIWERGYQSGVGPEQDRELDRWRLLNREPVYVRIGNNRLVPIRSLSRGAMIRIRRHDDARRMLGEKLDIVERRMQEAATARSVGWYASIRKRATLRRLADRIENEIAHHTRGIIANALSETGRAMLPEEAPEWWEEVSEEDEIRIAQALIEAGPLRFVRGRKPPKPSVGNAKKDGEPLTISSALRFWEAKLRLPPMALEDADLAQLLTALEEGTAEGAAAEELEVLG